MITGLYESSYIQEFQIPTDSYCSIEANYPVLVMEFMLGEGLEFGDPLMMMLPPVDQYSNDYHLKLVSDFTNYITVYVTPQFFQPQSIFLGNATFQSEHVTWHSISCYDGTVCGYVASIQRLAGEYHLYHQSPGARIGVSVHGIAADGSYGYIGGIQSDINTGKLVYICNYTMHEVGNRFVTVWNYICSCICCLAKGKGCTAVNKHHVGITSVISVVVFQAQFADILQQIIFYNILLSC